MSGSGSAQLEDLLAHADWLLRLARHLVREEEAARDLVQETWLAALRAPPRADLPPRPWLAEVLRNFFFRQRRGEGRRIRREEAATALSLGSGPQAEDLLERMRLQRLLAERVMAIEEPTRSVLLMRYYEGKSAAEIARTLALPAGTVRWRLKEGRDRLRRELDDLHGGQRPAWSLVLAPPAPAVSPFWKGALLMGQTKGSLAGIAAGVGLAVLLLLFGLRHFGQGDEDRKLSAASYLAPGIARGSLRVFGSSEVPRGAGFSGRVVSAGGQAVGNATVAATRAYDPEALGGAPRAEQPAAHVVTDATGGFRLRDLPAGTYQLVATAPGHAPGRSAPLVVSAGQTAEVELRLAAGGRELRGVVEDSGGGPIAGAWVAARSRTGGFATTTADARGVYVLPLEAGRHFVRAGSDGYAPGRASIDLHGNHTRDFELHPAGTVSGRVSAKSGGVAVGQALVRLAPEDETGAGAEVISAPDGRFAFFSLPPGTYTLSAARGRLVGFGGAPVRLGIAGRVENVELALESAFVIEGTVRDFAGEAVAGASIGMEDAAAQADLGLRLGAPVATTLVSGRYRIEGVLPGRYRLFAEGKPHAPSRSREVAVQGDVGGVDFVLAPGAVVVGKTLAHDGRPLAGARVHLAVQESAAMDSRRRGGGSVASGADGTFSIEGLGAGQMTIRADHDSEGSTALGPLPLGQGERKEVTIRWGRPATVSGFVRWEDGSPAAGARVRWSGFGRGAGNTLTHAKEDGSFTLGPLSAGTGMAQAEISHITWARTGGGPDSLHRKRVEVVAGRDATGVDLVLPKPDRTISGLILGPDGQPLADALVGAEQAELRPANAQVVGRRLSAEKAPATTGPDGRFLLEGLTRGRYAVFATHASFPPAETNDVEAGARDVRVRFQAGATLSGKAVAEDGTAVTRYRVTLLKAERLGATTGSYGGAAGRRQEVDERAGVFTLTAVVPGTYDLLVHVPDGRVGRVAGVSVGAGEHRKDLTIPVAGGVTLRGRVFDANTDKPLADVGVAVAGAEGHLHARTDPAGVFELAGQIPGRVLRLMARIRVTHVPETREVEVPVGAGTVELEPFRLLPLPLGRRPAFAQVGIETAFAAGPTRIHSVAPGSPAAKAGLATGDRLLAIDGRPVGDLGPMATGFLLTGEAGTTVKVKVAGKIGERTLTLTRVPRSAGRR